MGEPAEEDVPTFEQVTSEGEGALNRVIAELPAGIEIVVSAQSAPYPCGDGAMFAQRRDAYVPEGFDVEAFIRELPAILGDAIVLEEEVPLGDHYVSFTMPEFGDAGVSVSGFLPPDRPAVSLLVTSRCGSEPQAR